MLSNLAITVLLCLLGMSSAEASFNPNVLKPKSEIQSAQNQKVVVDINHANEQELMSLKGVGEKKAQAIIAYRQEHGLFKSINELSSVKGFGEKQLASIMKKNEGRIMAKTAV